MLPLQYQLQTVLEIISLSNGGTYCWLFGQQELLLYFAYLFYDVKSL